MARKKRDQRKERQRRKQSRPRRLTARLLLFCEHYANELDGTKAAIAAGYKPSNAAGTASRLLRNAAVLDRVQRRLRERLSEAGIEAGEALRRFKLMSQAVLPDVMQWDAAGKITLTASDELSPRAMVGLRRLVIRPGEHGQTISAEMWDPHSSLDRVMEAEEKAKLEKREKGAGPRNLGTIVFIPEGTPIEPSRRHDGSDTGTAT